MSINSGSSYVVQSSVNGVNLNLEEKKVPQVDDKLLFVKKRYGDEIGYEPVGFGNFRLDQKAEMDLTISKLGPELPSCVIGKVVRLTI